MDETQKRKISAREFIQRNKNIGLGVLTVFILLFLAYFILVFFYSRSADENISQAETQPPTTEEFFGNLLPLFQVSDQKDPELENDFLSNFNNPNRGTEIVEGESIQDISKVVKIEEKPILGYVVYDNPVSIKNYIKNKPKICAEKLEVVVKRDEKSTAVLNFQNTLRNIEDYEDTPDSGILDEKTREKIYIFQTRYAEILYKNKANKTPSRVMDPETIHFLNLLCGFDKENKDDFVQIPTLRYSLKETREIFDYNTDSKEIKKVEAKVATGTEDVIFSRKGDFAVFRKDIGGTIDTIFYNVRTKSVVHLENNITTLDFNESDLLIYGVPGYDGMSLKTYNHAGNVTSRLATIPLNEWNLKSISKNEIILSNKPSAFAESIQMVLNTDTKKLRQLAGPLLGLSTQKTTYPDFTIISIGGQGDIKTLLLNNKTRNLGDLGIKTFAEKCAETIFADGIFCAVPNNLPGNFVYPDDWYKGKMSTKDYIVFKGLSGTSTKIISYLENRPISVINLNVNKNGIFFMDEKTYSLYSLEI